MIFLIGGLAILLILVGGFTTYTRYSKARREMELPSLTNKYRNVNLRGQQLIEWSMTQDERLGVWLRDMPAKERKLLMKEVDRFCKQKKFDLAWVFDQQIEDQDVQTALDQSVVQFLMSQYSADEMSKDLGNYVALIDLLQNVDSRRYQEKTQTIYLQLANQNVIPKSNISLMFSSDGSRWKKAAKSIALASRTHRDMVNVAVREHMLGEAPRTELTPPTVAAAEPAT